MKCNCVDPLEVEIVTDEYSFECWITILSMDSK